MGRERTGPAFAPARPLPQRLIDLAAEQAGPALAQGSFKSIHALAGTGYVAAALLGEGITEAQMREALQETALQLRLRRKGLEEKLQALTAGQPYLGGGRHIVKTVGFDAGTSRTVMKHGGYPLSKLVGGRWRLPDLKHFDQRRKGPLLRLMGSVARQVLTGLQFLHDDGIVHSDVKLDNIVVGPKGRVTLIDLGVSRQTGEAWRGGTPNYLSRSRRGGRHEPIRPTEDLYALGCTVAFMATGRHNLSVEQAKPALDILDDQAATAFVNKCLAAEDAVGGFSTASEALLHPFPSSSSPAHEHPIVRGYVRQFFSEDPTGEIVAYYDPTAVATSAAAAAAAALPSASAAAPPRRPAPQAWTTFSTRYPGLVPLLHTVTKLAVESEQLRARIRGAGAAAAASTSSAAAAAPAAGLADEHGASGKAEAD